MCCKDCKDHPGVYVWLNATSNSAYVGSSANCAYRRGFSHAKLLNANAHRNKHFQCAWDKYGEDAFELIAITECNADKVLIYETMYMQYLGEQNTELYNNSKVAVTRAGCKHTDAARVKMSKALMGRSLSDEHRSKISDTTREALNAPGMHEKLCAIRKEAYHARSSEAKVKHRSMLSKANRQRWAGVTKRSLKALSEAELLQLITMLEGVVRPS